MRRFTILFLLLLTTMLTIVSCANIGTPDGGRYDEEPPEVIGASPADKAVNVKSKKIDIFFNEYVNSCDEHRKEKPLQGHYGHISGIG